MDIHTGRQHHIHPLLDHFPAGMCKQLLDQFIVKGAGKSRSVGKQGAVFLQPQTGGAVGSDDRWNSLFTKGWQYTAKGTGIARNT